ncbi:hypothetical protein EON65_38745 [archaeon]|nr:MAG: hypothetical protein EON65_38745 [archaeon]
MNKKTETPSRRTSNLAMHGSMVLSPSRLDASIHSMSPMSLAGSLSSRSVASLQSLPSLSIDSMMHCKPLSELEFAATMPVFRRTKFDLFGVGGENND